jgi:LPS sulfotransferase NodH/2-polyprenyl-3-methyl-5-hydroxy-6-metoxy-1,4-benzoquinol methylase
MQTPADDKHYPAPPQVGKVPSSAFDLPGPVPLRQSYVIAATPRSGSTLLSRLLTQTGVLGVPAEYWNFHRRERPVATGTQLAERLGATTPADYLTKLLACRTTKNGVFGIKLHLSQLQKALRSYPGILEHLAPVKYVYLERADKVAQAISLTKLVQGGWRIKRDAKQQKPTALDYDQDVIAHYVEQLERQIEGWSQWFEANGIEPYAVKYEDLAADNDGTVEGIKKFLGVENDEPQQVSFKPVERQGDRTNKDWAARFRENLGARSDPAHPAKPASVAPVPAPAPRSVTPTPAPAQADEQAPLHLFDRFEKLRADVANLDTKKRRFPVAMRFRKRYEGIIAKNRALFPGARVLDLHCGEGRFCVAALDAGAAHVTGLENRKRRLELAKKILVKYGFEEKSYKLMRAKTISGLRTFEPQRFDLIICQDFEELPDPYQFFDQLRRLRPKHVILDTAIVHVRARLDRGGGGDRSARAIAKFKVSFKGRRKPKENAKDTRYLSITCVPNHELVVGLAEFAGFRWRKVDWASLGLSDWAGVTDYESGRRQTYLLDRT